MSSQLWIRYQDFVVRLRRSGDGYCVEALAPNGNVEASHPSSEKLRREIHDITAPWHEDLGPVLILGSTQIARRLELGRSPSPNLRRVWNQMKDAVIGVENILKQAGWQDVRALGQKLREFLLPKDSKVWHQFKKALKDAEEEGKRLRLRLVIEAKELIGIPWEYLYVEELDSLPTLAEASRGIEWPFHRTSGFLAADGSISIVRQASLDYRVVKLPRTNQLRILVIASNPQYDPKYQVLWPPLKVEEELQRLQAALQELIDKGKVSLDFLKPAGPKASIDNLRKMLQTKDFHIIHYLGHAFYNSPEQHDRLIPQAAGAWLVLEGERGEAEYFKIEELASWLQGKSVRLVLFNACDTAWQPATGSPSSRAQLEGSGQNFYSAAQTLVQRSDVAIVVAMQFRMPDDSAPHFAEVFYRSLAAAMPADACVGAGRGLLSGRFSISRPDWGIPAVITSSKDLYVYAPGDEVLDAIAPQLTELPGSQAGNTFQNKGHVNKSLVKLDVEGERRRVLKLQFYLHSVGAYGGWMIQLEGPRFDARPYSRVRFKIAGAQGGERVEIKFKSHRTEYMEALQKEIDLEEEEVPQRLSEIIIEKTIQSGWQDVVIPLSSVNIDWSRLKVITVATNDIMLRKFLGRELPGEEAIYIAEICFE